MLMCRRYRAGIGVQMNWKRLLPIGLTMIAILALIIWHMIGGFKWVKQRDGWSETVFALDAEHVWAAGEGGHILFYNGRGWGLQYNGTTAHLIDITASDPNNVWAVAWDGRIYRSDGLTWELVNETGERLSCITTADENHVWAASWVGNVYFYDGMEWRRQAEFGEEIFDIQAVAPDNVWAVGGRYNEFPGGHEPMGPGYVYFFDGTSWSKDHEVEEMLFGVSAVDENNVWAVGERGLLLAFDENSWVQYRAPTRDPLWAVSAADEDNIWAIGSVGGEIFYFDGSSWSIQYKISLGKDVEGVIETRDISAADKEHIWVVGSEGIYFGSYR
jgi:hypothetical protein